MNNKRLSLWRAFLAENSIIIQQERKTAMKRNIIKTVSSALCSAVLLSASAFTSFADSAKDYTVPDGLDPAISEVKPQIFISQESISLYEAKDNPTRTVTISVSGADKKYAPTGIHIEYDERLTLKANEDGDPATLQQPAFNESECIKVGSHGLFLKTGAKTDAGKDGALWEFNLTLPSDVKSGDKFPITLYYEDEDSFTNVANDEAGKLMQAYAFSSGIDNGFIEIEITGVITSTTTTTTTTTTSTTTTTTTTTDSAPAGSTTTSTSGTGKAAVSTTKKAAAKTTAKSGNSPKTGVAGSGVATAFVLRKKED